MGRADWPALKGSPTMAPSRSAKASALRGSATSVDQLPHHLVAYWMYGHLLLLPIPDLDHTDYLFMVGANPAVSNGSIMTAPDVARRIEAIRKRLGHSSTDTVKIYAGGTQGSEGEMIRKISIGQLQGASMTSVGLHEITPEPQVEDIPFLIDSYEEYDYVHEKIRGKLEDAIAIAREYFEEALLAFPTVDPADPPRVVGTGGTPRSCVGWPRSSDRPGFEVRPGRAWCPGLGDVRCLGRRHPHGHRRRRRLEHQRGVRLRTRGRLGVPGPGSRRWWRHRGG